jgi:site-specific DNA recombinase
LRCGQCGIKLTATKKAPKTYKDGTVRAVYLCAKGRRGCGKVYIDRKSTDDELLDFVVHRLSDRRHASAVAAAQSKTAERLAVVLEEIRQCHELQKAMSDRLGRRELSLDAFDVGNEPLARDLARFIPERDALLAGVSAGPTEVTSPAALKAEWAAANTAGRRAMLINALGRDRLVVDPSTYDGGKRRFDRERIRLVEAPAPTEPAP